MFSFTSLRGSSSRFFSTLLVGHMETWSLMRWGRDWAKAKKNVFEVR